VKSHIDTRSRSEARLRAVGDKGSIGITLYDRQGKTIYYSKSCERITGYTEVERSRLALTDWAHPDDLEMVKDISARLLASPGMVATFEARLRRRSGEWIWLEFTTENLLDDPAVEAMVTTFRDIDQRKQAEGDLRHSEELLRDSQRIAQLGSWELDLLDNTLTWSDEIYRIFEIDQSRFGASYEAFLEAIHPDDREAVDSAYKESVKSRTPYEIVHRLLMDDGRIKYVIERCETFYDSEGRPLRSVGTVQDITGVRHAEDELRRMGRHVQSIMNSAGEGIFGLDLEGVITFANPSAARMLGYEADELIGKKHHETFHYRRPDGTPFPSDECHMHDAVRSGTRRSSNETLWRKDGTRLPIDCTVSPIRDDHTTSGAVVVFTDITERERAEQALRESEEQYRTLFEDSKDTIIMSTPEGEILDINAAGVELLGYSSRDELLGVNIAEQIFDDPAQRQTMLDDLRRQRFLKDYGLVYRTRKGEKLHVSATITPAVNEAGEFVYLRGIVHDMTAHLHLEEQLRQSQKLESIGQLAGGVAHDFNNYLTAIEGYTDLALNEIEEDNPAYSELQEVRLASERAANLARQLLIFSRREPMHLKPTNLGATVTDLLKMLCRLLGEQYTVITDIDDDLHTVSADTSRIEQVILNLAVNARDAMPEGGEITIAAANFTAGDDYVSTHAGSRAGEFVRLSVDDTGVGMDEETLSHIYEPFFTTKSATKGTGLGLSVVYGIVAQHEGWIEVQSSPGKGSTFYVFLPATPAGEGIDEGETIPIDQLRGHSERILVVEDEDTVRNLAVKMLSLSGYSVTEAISAEEAEEIFDQQGGDFALVFSDVVLPGETGTVLVERLLGKKPGLKIVLASGYSDIEGRETVRRKGYPFLQKPYRLSGLLGMVKDQLVHQPS